MVVLFMCQKIVCFFLTFKRLFDPMSVIPWRNHQLSLSGAECVAVRLVERRQLAICCQRVNRLEI